MPFPEDIPVDVLTQHEAIRTTFAEGVGVVTLLVCALISIPANRRYRATGSTQVRGFYRYMYGIAAGNLLLYTALSIYTFTTREVAGYNIIEHWGWLDSVYEYEPVYQGEWLAFIVLYMAPLLGLLRYPLLKHGRFMFRHVYWAMYPTVVLGTYAGFLLISVLLPQPVQQSIYQRPMVHVATEG